MDPKKIEDRSRVLDNIISRLPFNLKNSSKLGSCLYTTCLLEEDKITHLSLSILENPISFRVHFSLKTFIKNGLYLEHEDIINAGISKGYKKIDDNKKIGIIQEQLTIGKVFEYHSQLIDFYTNVDLINDTICSYRVLE